MEKIDSIVSKSRFDTYYQATGKNYEKALALYEWNIKISSAFYIVIQSLEISIRNRLHVLLNTKKPDWHKEGTHHFRSMSTEQQKQIKNAIDKIKSFKKTNHRSKNFHGCLRICDNKIVSELSFGFWKIMFSKRFVVGKFWDKQSFTELFPYYTQYINLKIIEDIEKKLDKIRNLRNRISHHEPIFKHDLKDILNDINLLLKWQSFEYKIWVDNLHDIYMLLDKKPI